VGNSARWGTVGAGGTQSNFTSRTFCASGNRTSPRRSARHPLHRHFTDQWLNLREIDFTTPDKQLYPEYDALLRHAMLEETRLFFNEVLRKNLAVAEFLHSDWTFLNERLAEHYGIDGVTGVAMRRVSLKPEHHRGGVLTHASVLKVSANGTSTSPVTRGAFVLDRILGIEPPPPPRVCRESNRTSAARRRSANNSKSTEASTTCNACHRVIDPPGFALENYDVMGGWRENYRSLGNDFPQPPAELTGGRNVRWRIGPPVDASGVTPDGRAFESGGIQAVAARAARRCFFGVDREDCHVCDGRAMGFSDRPELERIAQAVARDGHGLRTMIHAVVQSEIFRRK
jgi:hypothetical protein